MKIPNYIVEKALLISHRIYGANLKGENFIRIRRMIFDKEIINNIDLINIKLTINQINIIEGHLNKKKDLELISKIMKGFGYFLDIKQTEFFTDVALERIKNKALFDWRNKKRTDNSPQPFSKVLEPKIGQKYHLSWAHKGCVFVLKQINGHICFLDNPKHKRTTLLKAFVKDLRHIR